MEIMNNLKEIRIQKGLKQEDLADAAGVCQKSIGRIERCERNPSLETAMRLSRYLGMAVEDVFFIVPPNPA